MDIASVFGLLGGIVVMVVTILLSGSLAGYVDIPSIICTFGGTAAMTIMAFPGSKLVEGLRALKHVFVYDKIDEERVVNTITGLANKARKEGLLALEDAAQQLEDGFLKKGILLIVDGTDPELVRNILETELSFIEDRHRSNQGLYEFMANIAPAFGMIGTLIGLINMLANLSDPSSVGPNMAVAIITTLYGSLIANVFCNPVINKLKIRSEHESLIKEIMMEGMLSIQAGENPRIIQEKLRAFMSPKLRDQIFGIEVEKQEV